MKFVSISDLHIKDNDDQASLVLKEFLQHPDTKVSDTVFFLGDIFDLMAGNHSEYIEKYPIFFDGIRELLSSGKKVVFFEGNHDMHLKLLFRSAFSEYLDKITLVRGDYLITVNGKKFLFCHGDDLQKDRSYQIYKSVVTSGFFYFLANYVFTFDFIEKIGHKASRKSREVSSSKYDEKVLRKVFRDGSKRKANGEYDCLIAGHSHIIDDYLSNGFRYLNNGYPATDRSFISFDGNELSLKKLL